MVVTWLFIFRMMDILHAKCVVMLQLNESALLSAKLSAHVSRTVKWRIARCYDADALFKVSLPVIAGQHFNSHCCSMSDLYEVASAQLI